ncbi:amino acid adenylation domain-containing protein [Streptococcus pantholopis]|uniref:Non-ribosomal peptide synthetase n=1 Tax=Streptococcus pantholopis TaxID=1811193 RepID=A0A172Q9J5_9STRE|nr:amino acid adenylation domain-containing protein [Streptococcus pantholopis]AND80134.1 non-ribosomal peptide synthetase [Streptococcus pantholopis]
MEYYPLSYQQQKLYKYSKVHADDTEYNVLQGIELKQPLDKKHFEQVVRRILIEEPILRCRIVEKDFAPVQFAADNTDYAVTYKNINDEELKTEIKNLETEPFKVEGGPLFQIVVFLLSSGKTILFLRLHHIICDGWSFQLLMKKFTTYYFDTDKGNASSIKPPDYTYYDYAYEQTLPSTTEKYVKRRDFWEKMTNDNTTELNLPYSFAQKQKYTRIGNRKLYHMSRKQSKKIETFCREQKITPFTLLVSAYGALFSRLSGEKKLSVAVPVANRFKRNTMDICGYFTNTIPLDFDFSEKKSVQERLKQQHRDFMGMISKSDVDIDCPCNTMFVFQNRPNIGIEERNDLKYLRLSNGKSKYEVSLSVTFEDACYVFEWEYMCELFSEARIDDFNRYLFQLLDRYVDQPNEFTSRISLLNDSEIELQKKNWNETTVDFQDSDKSLKELFETAVQKYKKQPALIFEDDSLSYEELNRLVNVLCQKLRQKGVKKGQIIPILFDRSFEMLVAIHAILKLGCAYLPLDTELPDERMKFIVSDSGSHIVLTSEKFASRLPKDIKTFCISLKNLTGQANNPDTIINGDDKAYVIYTSGSTGNPKGVINTQAGIVNRLLWMQKQFPLEPNKRVLQKTSYTFDVSVWELVWPLLTGATIVIAKPDGHKNPEYIADIIISKSINTIHFVPSMLKKFLSTDKCTECYSLEYVICSGEALDATTCSDFYSKLDAQLVNLYGPTEAAIDVSCWLVKKQSENSIIPIGKPIANMKLYKLNDELMFEPPEVPGELYISGIGLAQGYLNNEEKTKDSFLECPWSSVRPFERLYKTGDIVKIDENGNFLYINRKDFQVKIRGQRVELAEIENKIQELDFVDDAIVMVRKKSDGQQVLVAFVKASKKDKKSITTFLSKHLMDYMIPRVFCFIDEIPTNVNGKADRKKLMTYSIEFEIEQYSKPQTFYEELVCSTVGQVLGISKVSRDANFYDLGGTSLSIYDVKIALEKKLQKKVPFELILGKDIVKDIALSLENYLDHKAKKSNLIEIQSELDELQNLPYEVRARNDDNQNIFMTGATGFLGAYLLRQYLDKAPAATMHCLVRAENLDLGFKRIKENMQYWGIWKDEDSKRLKVYCGDLTKYNLGLSQEQLDFLSDNIDVICHNGANVNFALSYDQIKIANVEGTKRILKLLESGKRKSMAYVSTISIFAKQDYKKGLVTEEQQPLDVNNLKLGYAKSKYVTEKILREYMNRNYDVEIFRVGRIMGSNDGGKENKDMFYKMVEFCQQIQMYPDISMNFNGIPVDTVSSLIVYASLYQKHSKIYHVVNPDVNVTVKLFDVFGDNDMAKVSWDIWYEKCMEYSDLGDPLARQVAVGIGKELDRQSILLDLSNTQALAWEAGIELPDIKRIVQKMINS